MLIATNDNNSVKFPNLRFNKIEVCTQKVDNWYYRVGLILENMANNTIVKVSNVNGIYSHPAHDSEDLIYSNCYGATYILKKNNKYTIYVNTSLSGALSQHNTNNISSYVFYSTTSANQLDLVFIKLE